MSTRILSGLSVLLICSSALFGQSPNSVQMLIGNLSDPDPGIRAQAAHNLAGFGLDAAPAMPALISVLGDKDPNVRYEAVIAIGEAGKSVTYVSGTIG
jgi:HEAT repeat protein